MSKPDTPASAPPACPARVVVGYLRRDGWAVPVYGEPTQGNPGAHAAPAPTVSSEAAANNPHFVRLGGVSIIEQLVERFYALMDTLPEAATIRAMHAADLHDTQQVLAAYLAEWMGGPRAYSTTRGAPPTSISTRCPRRARTPRSRSPSGAWRSACCAGSSGSSIDRRA